MFLFYNIKKHLSRENDFKSSLKTLNFLLDNFLFEVFDLSCSKKRAFFEKDLLQNILLYFVL